MKIVLNGENRELDREILLEELLSKLSLPSERVAVELNREVVPRRSWSEKIVKDGDRLEVVHFVGGG